MRLRLGAMKGFKPNAVQWLPDRKRPAADWQDG